MSVERVREHLRKWNKDGDIAVMEIATATVSAAANALGVEEAQIAKSISLKHPEKPALLIVVGGLHKIDNKKFKAHFGFKAKMLEFEEVEAVIGHPVGGICPFGINPDIPVYLDISLKQNTIVYPAGGNSRSVVKMTISELEQTTAFVRWVDVST